jgi:hypothetical protein
VQGASIVLVTSRKNSLLWSAIAATVISISFATGCHGAQPQAANSATTSSAIALQPYTAPDQSASAGVPSGWQVTNGGQTVITLTGPQGETVSLGSTFVAQSAAFQLGQRGANGIDLAMPYSATLPEKLTMIIQQNAAVSGKPAPQINITSATPIQLPASLGQCGRFVAGISAQQGQSKIMAVFCSLPLDSGGAYKNIMLFAQAPAAVAAQSAPTAQAIFQSYRIPAAWLQKKLSPHFAPPPAMAASGGAANTAAAAAAINRSTIIGMAGANNSANCFDLSVLRETPTHDLPRSCGGTKPD